MDRWSVVTAVIGPDQFTNGYRAATETLAQLPGPLLGIITNKLLAVTPDPDDDPDYDDGYRQALRDAVGGGQ